MLRSSSDELRERTDAVHLAFIIDPLQKLKPSKDSSIDLMVEAARRKHRISILEYERVSVVGGEVAVAATEVSVSEEVLQQSDTSLGIKAIGSARRVSMSTFEAVFLRKDPPFDSQYLALTYLLERAEGKTRFVNSPRGVRDVNEKLFATRYPDYMPATLVTWDTDEASRFAAEHEKVVLKTTFFGSGTGVFLSSIRDENFIPCVQSILAMEPRGPVIVQQYLPEGRAGDVRVMVLDGAPVAAVGRALAPGDFRANIAVGGTPYATEMSALQVEAATAIGRDLREHGIVFAGLDFIGQKLIEINVTSPTLIQELRRVSGFDMSKRILDHIGA
jgi:glutathione synthase